MVRRRLTRREIVQEDQIQAILSGILDWTSRHRNLLVAALVVLLTGAVGSYFWQSHRADLARNLQGKLAEGLEIYHAPVAETESNDDNGEVGASQYNFTSQQERLDKALEHFSALAAEAGESTVGHLASYYAALIKQELGQPEEAKDLLSAVILSSPETDAGNLARNLLAQIAESEDDYDRAVALLEEILELESLSFPKDYVLLRLAQSHEAAGATTEALGYYRRLTTEYSSSGYSQEARSRIETLQENEQSGEASQSVSEN